MKKQENGKSVDPYSDPEMEFYASVIVISMMFIPVFLMLLPEGLISIMRVYYKIVLFFIGHTN